MTDTEDLRGRDRCRHPVGAHQADQVRDDGQGGVAHVAVPHENSPVKGPHHAALPEGLADLDDPGVFHRTVGLRDEWANIQKQRTT